VSVTSTGGIAEDRAHRSIHRFWLVREGTQKQNASRFPTLGLSVWFTYQIIRATWKDYREIKGAAGWAAPVFAANIALV
jgi:hypothetical protein